MEKIGEGWHSEVFLTERGTVVKKFKKNLIKNFRKEVYFLKKLEGYDFVPKIYDYNEKKLSVEMEFVEGKPLKKIVQEGDHREIKDILKKLFEIAKKLDEMGIDKGEMVDPEKHVYVDGDRIILIDWERARESKKPQNVTQLIAYVVRNKKLRDLLEIDEKRVIDLAKQYKKNYSPQTFQEILHALRLK